jgi:DMSO/TMAO reductase YedYZ molybdopterin-dependent catalytic subunit
VNRPRHSPDLVSLPRRRFLGALAGIPPLVAAGTLAAADEDAAPGDPSGLIIRQKGPDNLEFPFSRLDSFLTPTDQFFVRNHFDVPTLAAADWKLKIEGHVERPFEIGYEELRKLPSQTSTALLECAGNGRVFLKGTQLGLRWELGGVSNGEWTGVPLAGLLDRAGIKPGAVDVILEGADRGESRPPFPATPGVISFSRSLPVTKATSPEVLLAYQMNGADLTVPHGYPVRAIVPGWYGMASIKWLTRIVVSEKPFDGFFQTFSYTLWTRPNGIPTLTPVTEIDVKSQIARPSPFEVVRKASPYRIFGAAWSGNADVLRVDVSTDSGKSWSAAKLLGRPVPFAWQLWELDWKTPEQPGRVTLLSRATDSRGRTQPAERDADRRDAMITHTLPIEVDVR